MSLASLLITGTGDKGIADLENVDKALDVLFRSNAALPAPSSEGKNVTKLDSLLISLTKGHKRKRMGLSEVQPAQLTASPKAGSSKASKRKKFEDASEQRGRLLNKDDMDGEEDHSTLEDAYLTRHAVPTDAVYKFSSGQDSVDEEDDEDARLPQHETHAISPLKRRDKHRKEKYVPPNETPAQLDARTIFVGNVSIDVAKSKSLQKQLKRHITSRAPGAKIESMRFRSVAFASTTAPRPVDDVEYPHSTPVLAKQKRHQRAAIWRGVGKDMDEEEHGSLNTSSFLTSAEKKRVAFIKGEFHKDVDSVNVYIVFGHTSPEDSTDILCPIDAARNAVSKCDGSVFLGRTLRADRVGQWRAAFGNENFHEDIDDPRKSLFVGNLDFAAREEDLRIWFEGVVSQARGPRVSNVEGGEGKWVQRIRIIRDRDTQLGKGFAYVRFADRESVDEVLALEQDSLKFAKRKLRVQRCRVLPLGGAFVAKPKASEASPAQKPVRKASTLASVPAGDPLLGEKLVGLSKKDRKAAKAANMERVQRRLAKKKTRTEVNRELRKRGTEVRERRRKKDGGGHP